MSATAAARPRSVVRAGFAVLARGVRIQPRPFAVAIAGAALHALMTVAAALVLGRVTDEVVTPALAAGAVPRAGLALGVAAILGVAVLRAAGVVARRLGATLMQLRLEGHDRREVTRAYQRLPLSWHQRHSTGSLLSTANADVEATWAPIAPLPFAAGVVVMLLATAGALVATDPLLALVGFTVLPAIALANWRYNRRTAGPAASVQHGRAAVAGTAHESFDGALVVKTLGREAAEAERFAEDSERLRDELINLGRIRAVYDPLLDALPNLGVLAVLVLGTQRIAAGALTVGDLVQFAYLFTILAFPMRLLGYLLGELPRSVAGWQRVAAVLDAPGERRFGALDPAGRGPARAELVGVSFRHPGADDADAGGGLHDVSFPAPPGRTVAIVGSTGAGKSTIVSLLVRLADPDAGVVRLDGRDLRDLAEGVVPGQVAVVFQESFLFDDTVRGNITLGAPFDDAAVEAALRLAQAHEFVAALPQGLGTRVGERGTSLSGGQRQRIALARALVRRPRLLVLDDATSSVDPHVEAAILRGLQEAALPSTIVVVAYRRATIALADEVVLVERGAVTARGPADALAASVPAYRALLEADDRPEGSGPGAGPR